MLRDMAAEHGFAFPDATSAAESRSVMDRLVSDLDEKFGKSGSTSTSEPRASTPRNGGAAAKPSGPRSPAKAARCVGGTVAAASPKFSRYSSDYSRFDAAVAEAPEAHDAEARADSDLFQLPRRDNLTAALRRRPVGAIDQRSATPSDAAPLQTSPHESGAGRPPGPKRAQ